MSEYFCDKGANDVWIKAVNYIKKAGVYTNSRVGETQELLHTLITIENPSQRWIYSRTPGISIAYALAELVWTFNGDDDAEIINKWNPSLVKYAGTENRYYGAYGKRLRERFGFDQLDRVYYALQSVPESRQVVMQIYDVKTDLPFEDGKPRNQDIPCNICSLLKIRDGKLVWSQIMRSNDIFRGMPYDFVQFTSMQEIIAGWLGVELGQYSHYSDSLHLYNIDVERMGVDETIQLENTDSLMLSKNEFDNVIAEIYIRMKELCKSTVSGKEILVLGDFKSQYDSYNNIMYILAAYIAEKNNYLEISNELLAKCTNKLYVFMWNNWKGMYNKR